MITTAIKPKQYIFLFISLGLVYVLGLLVPLMDEDASHHADIALQMVRSHDYIRLLSKGNDYLDKPHLLFWTAATFFNMIGVTALAYKLPSFLITCLGIYSTYRLGKRLYNAETGMLAALITASSQAFILANNDVRMDAMLTGFIIFATWQLCEAVYSNKWYNYVLGALGMALGFSTKGMIGVAMPAIAVLFLILYQRNWKKLFNVRWLMTLLLLAIFISPVLYCYYIQFDLHPEKEIRGSSHLSGVKFILLGQSAERFDGGSFGKGKVKPFFFFHTMLWAFLPWAFITYYAIISKLLYFIKNGLRYVAGQEFLTLGTILVIFTILSTAGYQLPHYLNVLFPFFGIITARALLELQYSQSRFGHLKLILKFQYIVIGGCILVAIVLNTWIFPLTSILIIALSAFLLVALFQNLVSRQSNLQKIVIGSALSIILVNVLLNGNFYPKLLRYQAGPVLAKVLTERKINHGSVYKFNTNSYAFDFYSANIFPFIEIDEISNKAGYGQELWLYTNDEGKNKLEQLGLPFKLVASSLNTSTTKLKPKFLNPNTRKQACGINYLIRIESKRIVAQNSQ